MFFEPHEKTIYSPEGSDKKFDPLAVERALTIATGGKLNDLLTQWRAASDGLGDISPEGKAQSRVAAAEAEGQLAAVARAAFGLPPFPDCTDADALEWLCDYLRWMEGKGSRGSPSPDSSTNSQGA